MVSADTAAKGERSIPLASCKASSGVKAKPGHRARPTLIAAFPVTIFYQILETARPPLWASDRCESMKQPQLEGGHHGRSPSAVTEKAACELGLMSRDMRLWQVGQELLVVA